MFRIVLSCATALGFVGCASVPPVKVEDLTRDVRSVSFVQNGRQPKQVAIGIVDGKTFWAAQSAIGVPANASSQADQRMASQATAVSAIGGAVGAAMVNANREQYQMVVDYVSKEREAGLDAGRAVLPMLAQAWGQTYDTAKLVVLPDPVMLSDPSDHFAAADPGGDLVLAFTLEKLRVTERVSLSSMLVAPYKLALGSRNVTTELTGEMSAFRRGADGKLGRVWSAPCRTNLLDAPADDWDALVADPARTQPLLDSMLPVLAKWCQISVRERLVASAAK